MKLSRNADAPREAVAGPRRSAAKADAARLDVDAAGACHLNRQNGIRR
jgi:hypothetical protein